MRYKAFGNYLESLFSTRSSIFKVYFHFISTFYPTFFPTLLLLLFPRFPSHLPPFPLFPQPLLPGEKRVKEWWENTYIYGMGFNFLLMFIVVMFRPDTSYVARASVSLLLVNSQFCV